MKSIAISGSLREGVGTKQSKDLRLAGNVPCVLYGGAEQVHFYAPELAFKNLVYTPDAHTVDLTVDGISYQAIMKEIQFHAVTDKILHIDFLTLSPDKLVIMEIPVKVVGNSVGVRAGGKLVKKMRKLTIKALPKHLPDVIEISIDDLDIGNDVRVRDIKMEGVQILDAANNIIIAVQTTRQSLQEATTVEAAKK